MLMTGITINIFQGGSAVSSPLEQLHNQPVQEISLPDFLPKERRNAEGHDGLQQLCGTVW